MVSKPATGSYLHTIQDQIELGTLETDIYLLPIDIYCTQAKSQIENNIGLFRDGRFNDFSVDI